MENAKSEVRTKKRKRRQSFFRSAFFILCLLFLFGIVRLYVIESLHISTDSMETTLHKGDFVLVNKFPFGNKPERRDIVLFTSPLRKDSLAAPLLISRCIGIAGDTIRVNANGYRINGEEYPHSPNTLNTYFMPNEGKAILMASVKKLHIPLRDFKEERDGFTLALTILGALRELLGTGKIFGAEIWPEDYGMVMFVLAPGAFIVLGYLIALVNRFKKA